MRILIYDFEVFHSDWMVVIKDHNTGEKYEIINDRKALVRFYNEHTDDIFVGYNSRNYDQFIMKAIIDGLDPYKVTTDMIEKKVSGYKVVRNFKKYPFNNFDIQTGFHSLKQLEGFMGSTIKESSVDFTIQRKLTDVELEEVLMYCNHDVDETDKVFTILKSEYDAQLALLNAFELDMSLFNKTKAQLSAHILGAEQGIKWNDEFNLSFPDTLVLTDYPQVLDWYNDDLNRSYNNKLEIDIYGVPHVFAWGGIHGAIPNYIEEGEYILSDISSMYPAMMIEYDYLSRNVVNPDKYRQIRDDRIRLKKIKDPRQLPMKIVLNSTYGASKDKFNGLYDPLMANNVCVCGQLLLLDLIERTRPFGKLIQLI